MLKLKYFLETAQDKRPKFNGLIYKIRNPKCTVLFFSTGKIVIVGCTEKEQILQAYDRILKLISKFGLDPRLTEMKINNIASTLTLPFQINREKFIRDNQENVDYNPELFPGVIFRIPQTKITAIIFYQGKIILTGTKSELEIFHTIHILMPLLKKCKRFDSH